MVPVGYKTQAEDTSIEAELVQFGLWRRFSPAQKEALFRRVAKRVPTLIMMGIRHQFPDASPGEIKRHYITRRLGAAMADLILANHPGALIMEDSIWLARRLAEILDSLHIPYYVGGSVASSLHGEVRYTEDLDVVVNIDATQVQALIEAMTSEFYISEVAVEDAIMGRMSSFNVIHLETTEKADIFLMRDNEFSHSQMARRQLYCVTGEVDRGFYICSPEDTVLQKLIWFRMTENESQKQWRDILGVLKLQGARLDFAYMWHWGERLGLLAELEKAFTEAGV
ncbi:MAG TPA: hypothetical protein IGS52_12895 [Oscillatoriaceae cyanobacterium M33_DOE_052]|uniref:Nucleotidyltransferase family protein n=1 Tax=Planktothricoides sp. SpSt-374 TaxID=2282167 RepID=A0A7C3ZM22_9CYAN|nr:hypothetical protein [Oscillatoriaceae cyanobacterium M33_DOE_052]